MTLDAQGIQVLRRIRHHDGISRKALAEEIGVSQASITNLTRALMEQQYIVEGERVGNGRGRKEILLQVNSAKFCYLGIDIGVNRFRLAISDSNLQMTHYKECLVAEFRTEPNPLVEIVERITSFLAESEVNPEVIDAIGIGVTGIVDKERKLILNVPNVTRWETIEIVDGLSKQFQCPVYLDESGRVMAHVEKIFGQAKEIDDFIFAHIAHSVVAGVMINGQLLRGFNNVGGLLGHITVDENLGRCLCGNYGCLENQVVFSVIKNKYMQRSGQDYESIVEALKKNDKIAIDICMESGKAIGIALSNVVNLFNPQAIFISGAVFEHLPLIFEETKRTILLRANRFASVELQLLRSSYGDKQGIMGALALASSELLA